MSQILRYTPPLAMIHNAAEGLKLHRQFQRGGSQVAISRAVYLQKNEGLSQDFVKRFYQYFKSHAATRNSVETLQQLPLVAYITWQLGGGDEGYAWVKQCLITSMSSPKNRQHPSTAPSVHH